MNNKPLVLFLTGCLASVAMVGCDDPGEPQKGGDSETSSLDIKLRAAGSSANAQQSIEQASPANAGNLLPVSCNAFYKPSSVNTGPLQGSCITPISITGSVSNISIGGDYFGGGTRLLGGGSGFGQEYIIEGEAFDLANPLSLGGEDNAQDNSLDNLNTRVGVTFNYMDIQFAMPRANDQTAYWTYRYAFMPHPFTTEPVYTSNDTANPVNTSTTVADCLNNGSSEVLGLATNNNANLLGGSTGVRSGDILVCIKDGSNDTCASSDFQWLNTETNELVSTRPDSSVFQFSGAAEHKVSCEQSDPGFEIDLGGHAFTADLYDGIHFSAELDGDFKLYQFKKEGDSEVIEGDEMTMFIDFDTRNSLFVTDLSLIEDMTLNNTSPDYSNFEDLSDGELAQMVWFKPLLLWHDSPCKPWQPGACTDVPQGIRAQISIAISGETEPPVYECASDSSQDDTCVEQEPAYQPQ